MQAVKALCFDLDGTLLDGGGFPEAIRRTCSELAATRPGLDAGRLLEANGEVWRAYWPRVEQQWTLGVLDGATVSLEAWRRALRSCRCDDDSLARRARDTHRRYRHEAIRLFDEAYDLFMWPARTGLPLALITNGASDTQRETLDILGMEHRFGALVISGEVGIAKPDPTVFRIAIEQLRVNPEHVWHVGDSLSTDVAGAKAGGLTAVWLNRARLPLRAGDPKPDYEVGSLTELTGLLASVL